MHTLQNTEFRIQKTECKEDKEYEEYEDYQEYEEREGCSKIWDA
jgi:hypothetical protein